MKQLKIKLLKNQLETVIHHALIKLYHEKDFGSAKDFIRLLNLAEIKSTGIKFQALVIRARREAKSNDYEIFLKKLGDNTSGSYAVMPVVINLIEQINWLGGGSYVSNNNNNS